MQDIEQQFQQGKEHLDKQLRDFIDGVKDAVGVNVLFRNTAFQKLLDPRRDVDSECGYPDSQELTSGKLRHYYDRDPVSQRVVNLYPEECWKFAPKIFETENETKTVFEKALDEVGQSLRGQSWYKPKEDSGNPLWEHLLRLDKQCGIGNYGILLIGIDDGLDLSEPIEGLDTPEELDGEVPTSTTLFTQDMVPDSPASQGNPTKKPTPRKLLYLRAFSQDVVEIERFETNKSSPRYGLPVLYSVTLNDLNATPTEGIGLETATVSVHWSRILHVADNVDNSEVFGKPRLLVVLNRVMDLYKVYGGCAEGYWQAATPGLAFSSRDPNVQVDKAALRETVDKFMNSLQRYVAAVGMDVDTIAPTVNDPSNQVERLLEAICIVLGCPKRIFMGSERGELSSAQDKGSWDERVAARRENFVTPKILIPFIDRLISIGVLPEPSDGFDVKWPDIDDRSKQEKADWASTIIDVIVKYIQGGVFDLMDPKDFLVKILDFTIEEADDIIKQAEMKFLEEPQEQPPQQGQQPPQPSEQKKPTSKPKEARSDQPV